MKRFLFIGVVIALFWGSGQAETMYVSDLAEITLRTGKGVDHKIIALVKSGVQVEVIEPDDQWTKVRLPSGKEGWVVSRFLTSQVPSKLELEELKKKYNALLSLADAPFKELTMLQEENARLRAEAGEKESSLQALKNDYEALKKESEGLSKLKAANQESREQLTKQKQRTEELEESLAKLERARQIRWFLSGAAVLLVGFLLGFTAKRQRRRSSLLS